MALQTAGTATTDTAVRDAAVRTTIREISRGGLAGLVVGVLLAGIGGRVVMRIAALLVPDAAGRFTENGNQIGVITFNGSAGLVLFVGLFFGAVIGSLWVVMRPWLPVRPALRALVTVPIGLALGTTSLVLASNTDFTTLGHDPGVVAVLVVYIASFGPALTLTDAWLERRLPQATAGSRTETTYWLITVLGLAVTFLGTAPAFLGGRLWSVGVAIVGVGLATLWWWSCGAAVSRCRRPGLG